MVQIPFHRIAQHALGSLEDALHGPWPAQYNIPFHRIAHDDSALNVLLGVDTGHASIVEDRIRSIQPEGLYHERIRQ